MEMLQLNMTDSGIYYLYDYIPVRQFRFYSEEAVAISRKIWDYKDGDEDALNVFTKNLAYNIIETGGCPFRNMSQMLAKVTRSTYVERDAVIAALSDATMVIECDVKSGTMHTVDAVEQMKRKLACYYIDDVSEGKYGGNELMLKDKGAIKITDTEEMAFFLEQLSCIPENTKESEPKQICIEDLLRADAE